MKPMPYAKFSIFLYCVTNEQSWNILCPMINIKRQVACFELLHIKWVRRHLESAQCDINNIAQCDINNITTTSHNVTPTTLPQRHHITTIISRRPFGDVRTLRHMIIVAPSSWICLFVCCVSCSDDGVSEQFRATVVKLSQIAEEKFRNTCTSGGSWIHKELLAGLTTQKRRC